MLEIRNQSDLTEKHIKRKAAGYQRLSSNWLWLFMAVYKPSFADTETPHTLEAIKITQQYYGNLPEMKFRDWANLIKTVKFENESDGSSICSNL